MQCCGESGRDEDEGRGRQLTLPSCPENYLRLHGRHARSLAFPDNILTLLFVEKSARMRLLRGAAWALLAPDSRSNHILLVKLFMVLRERRKPVITVLLTGCELRHQPVAATSQKFITEAVASMCRARVATDTRGREECLCSRPRETMGERRDSASWRGEAGQGGLHTGTPRRWQRC
ncbi:hypothetical protein E2C01_004715 [Portunus trituberculatus]|uniref:Uncharacterized protein n=1 Tax=Portunus trituberculatus TaxID=210409 RepID=A0A5B7CSE8_PORTR|nr:hypothetical protein [Portunus trituberculatus]